MCKKLTLVGLAALAVGGLMFGNRLIPYAQTGWNKMRDSVQKTVPVSFQIDAAKQQLEKIDPEIKEMVRKIAREKSEIKRLNRDLEGQTASLEQKKTEILALRNHLNSGEEVYVATNGKSYSTPRVEEDLRHRFSVYQTAEQTRDKTQQIVELRQKSLEAAFEKLESAQALQRELEIQVENLNARQRMIEVANTASSVHIDDSQLARTSKLIEEISANLDAEEEMLELAPKYLGEIPVSPANEEHGDIANQIDTYFSKSGATSSGSTL